MLAGGISLAGAKYAGAAAELEAHLAVIEEERRQLEISPQEEMDELVALYEAKGLSASLANEVAVELTARDPLAAHVDAEHGLGGAERSPLATGRRAGFSFAAGAGVPLVIAVAAPDQWRVVATFVAVVASLAITSLILARASRTNLARILLRTLVVGNGRDAPVAGWWPLVHRLNQRLRIV